MVWKLYSYWPAFWNMKSLIWKNAVDLFGLFTLQTFPSAWDSLTRPNLRKLATPQLQESFQCQNPRGNSCDSYDSCILWILTWHDCRDSKFIWISGKVLTSTPGRVQRMSTLMRPLKTRKGQPAYVDLLKVRQRFGFVAIWISQTNIREDAGHTRMLLNAILLNSPCMTIHSFHSSAMYFSVWKKKKCSSVISQGKHGFVKEKIPSSGEH